MYWRQKIYFLSLEQVTIMLKPNYSFSSGLGLKNTLFNQSGGSGSFYQGDGGAHDDDSHDDSNSDEREPMAVSPPIDPATIELIDINDLIQGDS